MRQVFRVDEAQPLNPGVLRDQITWQRKVNADLDEHGMPISQQNSFGEDIFDWTDVITVKAQIKGVTGSEMGAAGQRWAEAKYQIRQHYVPGLQPGYRGAWLVNGEMRYLDILDIADQSGTGRVLTIMAKEWVGSESFG